MKKTLFSLIVAIALALPVSVMATGIEGVNPSQSGSIVFTTNTLTSLNTYAITNSFPFAFQTIPVLQFFPQTTNAAPYTNLFVTATNFAVEISSNNSTYTTGGTLNWSAFQPNTRIEYGTFAISSGAGTTNYSFPTAYAQFSSLPQVFLTSQLGTAASNALVTIVSVTYTNFSIVAGAVSQTNSWMSIGPAANPGAGNVTY